MLGLFRKTMRAAEHARAWKSGRYDNLGELEREAIRLAMELENAEVYWTPTAILNLVGFYAVAFTVMGAALRIDLLWAAGGGALAGLAIICSFCSHAVFAKLNSLNDLKARQMFVGMWVKIAIIIGALGAVGWIVRTVFFR